MATGSLTRRIPSGFRAAPRRAPPRRRPPTRSAGLHHAPSLLSTSRRTGTSSRRALAPGSRTPVPGSTGSACAVVDAADAASVVSSSPADASSLLAAADESSALAEVDDSTATEPPSSSLPEQPAATSTVSTSAASNARPKPALLRIILRAILRGYVTASVHTPRSVHFAVVTAYLAVTDQKHRIPRSTSPRRDSADSTRLHKHSRALLCGHDTVVFISIVVCAADVSKHRSQQCRDRRVVDTAHRPPRSAHLDVPFY